jgi:hypothetical protein
MSTGKASFLTLLSGRSCLATEADEASHAVRTLQSDQSMDPTADLAVDAALMLIDLAEKKMKMPMGGDGRGNTAFHPDGSTPDASVGPEPSTRLPPSTSAALHTTLESALTAPVPSTQIIHLDQAWGPYVRVLPGQGGSVLDWSPEEVSTMKMDYQAFPPYRYNGFLDWALFRGTRASSWIGILHFLG